MKHIHSISDIIANYDGFIIDLWGVMHDGSNAYPGAKAAMALLAEHKKHSIFLSNAPRRAEKAQSTLDRFDIPRAHYDTVMSSGEVAFQHLSQHNPYGPNYYYLGPDKDSGVFGVKTDVDFDENVLQDSSDFTRVMDPAEADFILCAGFEYDFQPLEEFEPVAQRLAATGLPLVCINPDMEVIKMDGTHLWCAGWVAQRYAQLGGTVKYFGKPYADVYDTVFGMFSHPGFAQQTPGSKTPAQQAGRGDINKSRLLAIGDNLLTDIKGANAQGIDSLLITGGILTSEAGKTLDELALKAAMDKAGERPTYFTELFQ